MVDREEVLDVAENARIDVSEEEAESFTNDFDEILEMFSKLEEIDTENVEPAFHPVEVDPGSREDEKEECLSRDQAFQNTDNEEDGMFKGPSV